MKKKLNILNEEIRRMHQLSSYKEGTTLNEQDGDNAQSSNVTLTDTFNGLGKEPKVLNSNDGSDITIAFPPATDGEPIEGDYGVKIKNSVILSLGGKYYLVIGYIGKLDKNNKVVDEKPMAMVISTSKFNGTGAGSPVRIYKILDKVNSLPFLTAQIPKIMDMDKELAARWFEVHKDILVKTFKMTSSYGIDTSILDDPKLDAFIKQTKSHIQS